MAQHFYTEADGPELVRLLNELTAISGKTIINDWYLQYHAADDGWCVTFGPVATEDWVQGTSTPLVDALRAKVSPIRAQLDQDERRRQRRRPAKRRKKPLA